MVAGGHNQDGGPGFMKGTFMSGSCAAGYRAKGNRKITGRKSIC